MFGLLKYWRIICICLFDVRTIEMATNENTMCFTCFHTKVSLDCFFLHTIKTPSKDDNDGFTSKIFACLLEALLRCRLVTGEKVRGGPEGGENTRRHQAGPS